MGVNDFILALYVASAVMALAAAFLPGSSGFGRMMCAVMGVTLLGWPAALYSADDFYPLTPAVVVVPPLLLVYAIATYRRYLLRRTCYPANEVRRVATSQPMRDRRGPGRRTLPGEYGHVPVNVAPPAHDPWAALYGSSERERLRGSSSARHRAYPAAPGDPGAAGTAGGCGADAGGPSVAGASAATGADRLAATTADTGPSAYARQAAFAAMQAYVDRTAPLTQTDVFTARPDWLPADDPRLSDPPDRPNGY